MKNELTGILIVHENEATLRRRERTFASGAAQWVMATGYHNLGYCYNDARVIRWVMKQAMRGFQGVTGSFA